MRKIHFLRIFFIYLLKINSVNMQKLLLLLILLPFFAWSQDAKQQEVLFSEAIGKHLKTYKKKARKAYRHKDYERAQILFDSLVNHQLRGTYLDNFKVSCVRTGKTCFNDFKKPMYLMTYASWCVASKGEVQSLNALAKKYKKEIDFVVLFWDKRKQARRVSRKYNRFVHVLYVDELSNREAHLVKTMKHSLGLPTTFYISQEKEILGIEHLPKPHIEQDIKKCSTIQCSAI